jgi:hypothetical protein
MKRNNILTRKRLMKTTTYITALLVAVIMSLSSAANVGTVNENLAGQVYSSPTAPLGMGDDTDTPTPPVPELSDGLREPVAYSGSTKGTVVYDNGMGWNNGLSAQDAANIGLDSIVADDFVLAADADVSDVHWIGVYWNPGPPAVFFDWNIEFYDDAAGWPGASIAAFSIPESDVAWIDLGGGYYEFSCNLPSTVSLNAGTTYWISLQGDGDFPPQSGVGGHFGIIGNAGKFRSAYFGFPVWVHTSVVFGINYDLAFQLTEAAEFDAYVEDIIAPNSASEFCPCTDVEVTVHNAGLHDEVIPVGVEIRRYMYKDDFSMPWANWMDIGWGNNWFQSGGEPVPPFAAFPLSPPTMMELDSGMTGPGGADLVSIMPFDLTGACHPMMRFYMWHDTYSSDDYIEVYVNDGGGWTSVGGPYYRLCCPGCDVGWKEHVIDLSAYTGLISITFEGNCDNVVTAYDLQIDDFAIYDQEYYQEDDIAVAAGETETLELPQWCPCHWQDPAWANTWFQIEVVACTMLPTDEIPSNDCEIDTINVYMPFEHDIAAISITKPVDKTVPIDTYEMCGEIKNVGQYQECCFSVYMTVEEQYLLPGYNVITEGFEGAFPPAGWSQVVWSGTGFWQKELYGWDFYEPPGTGSWYAEADSDEYWLDVFDVGLFTPSMNLVGAADVEIVYDRNFQDYAGDGAFAVSTYSGGTGGGNFEEQLFWKGTDDPSAGVADHTLNFDPSGYANPADVYVEFWYSTEGGTYAWKASIDDVTIDVGSTAGYYAPEYEDSFCVDEIDVCEVMEICFDDWTPAPPYPDCGSKTYRICIESRLCDPMDQNPANDKHCELITVEFWHDVELVEFTSPSVDAPGDILWTIDATAITGDIRLLGCEVIGDSLFVTGASDFTATYLYEIDIPTATLLNQWPQAPHSTGWGWRDLVYDGQYLYASVNTQVDQIDPATGTWTGVSLPGPGISPCRALAYDPATDHFWTASFGSSYYEFDRTGAIINVFSNPWSAAYGFAWDDICGAPNIWVHDQGGSGEDMHQLDPTTGTHTGLTYTGPGIGIAGGLAMIDRDGIGQLIGMSQAPSDTVFSVEVCETGPQLDVWVTCGPQDFCATFANTGTFDEIGCTITWDLYDNNDPNNPVWIDGGSDTIDLLEGEILEDHCFGSYNFGTPGFYLLVVTIVDPGQVDCDPSDNTGQLGIGVDCDGPRSCHDLDPAAPNGANNWYITPVTVTIDAFDDGPPPQSGIKEIKYIHNGVPGTIPGASGSFVLDTNGVHYVEYWAVDNAGNEEQDHGEFEVAIDTEPPVVDLIYEAYEEDDGWYVDFTAAASDGTSGMDKVEFRIGSSLELTDDEPPYQWTVKWEDGYENEDFKAKAFDNAGNDNEDVVDGGGINAVPIAQQSQAVPVWKVMNPLVG